MLQPEINYPRKLLRMKNVVITSTCLLLAIVFAACVSQTTVPELEESSQEITPTNSDEESTPTTENGVMIEPATPTNTFTLAEVEKHAAPEDCWLAIEGKVYDVTDFIASGNHPGGEAIVMGCGTDATEIFNDRPNGSGAHSDAARAYLPQFYIGDLEG